MNRRDEKQEILTLGICIKKGVIVASHWGVNLGKQEF